jgi:hypothetical protein
LRGFIFQRRRLPCTSKITASTETGAGSTTGCGCGWSTAPGAGLHRDDVSVDCTIVRTHQHAAGARRKGPRPASPTTMPPAAPAED